jgi:diadenosine tetraphosphatase ApaH/serine/threonine PP2A family protein phosphatase
MSISNQRMRRRAMSNTFVIPDIHGRLDLLNEALAEIAARSKGGTGAIVTIGDYVDKGPASKGVIERLLSGVSGDFELVTLKGNHDAMMIDALREPSKMADWLAKGGDTALASYGGGSADVPQSHIDWLDRLRLFYVDTHRLYVHAGVDAGTALNLQRKETLLWKRYPKGYSAGFGDLHVVHGHDNDPDGPLLYEGRTNLDTQAWRTGRLTIGVFDDDRPGGPIDLIVIKGAPAGR